MSRLTVGDSWSCCVRYSSNLRCFFQLFHPDSSVCPFLQILGNFLAKLSLWRWSFISNLPLKRTLSRWAWSAHWLAFNNYRLPDSISRCASNNANSKFVVPKFGSPYFHQKKLAELFIPGVLGDLIHQKRIFWEFSENNFLWLSRLTLIPFRRLFFGIDYAPLIAKHHLSSFLSSKFSSIACFLCLHSEEQNQWETCKTENSNTVGTQNCPMFPFAVFVKTTPHKTIFAVWISTRNSRTGQKLNKLVQRQQLNCWHEVQSEKPQQRVK